MQNEIQMREKQFFSEDQIEKRVTFGFQVKQDALQNKENFMKL